MKKLLIPFCFLLCISTQAQTTIIPLYDTNSDLNFNDRSNGEYHKDTFNDFNLFEGTWLFTNGNTSLKIVLDKVIKHHVAYDDTNYYKDILIGEYQYIENGVEKVNTLGSLNLNIDPYENNISGSIIRKYNPNISNACYNCNPGDVQVLLDFEEPGVNIMLSNLRILLRHFTENGTEKLEAVFVEMGSPTRNLNDNKPLDEYSIPFPPGSSYILIKQP